MLLFRKGLVDPLFGGKYGSNEIGQGETGALNYGARNDRKGKKKSASVLNFCLSGAGNEVHSLAGGGETLIESKN